MRNLPKYYFKMLIPIQEFKAHLAKYIAQAQSGDVIGQTLYF